MIEQEVQIKLNVIILAAAVILEQYIVRIMR